jgi:hypothetical protein
MKLDVDYKKVGKVPIKLINNVLDAIVEEDWFADDYRNKVGNMSNVNSIAIFHTPLCASARCDMLPIRSIRKEKLYSKYFPLVEPILDELRKHYEFRQFSCFIARLKPHGEIGKHIDKGSFLELCHRVHVPLKTNPLVKYCIEDKEYYWEAGNIYEFDNTRMHGVINDSEEYRLHLVVNLYNLTDEELAKD